MSTIEIKDIHKPESELFIEELGKIHGGSGHGGSAATTLALGIGEEDSPSIPSDPSMGGIEEMLADAFAKYPEIFSKMPGYPSNPLPYPAGPMPVEGNGGIGN